MRRLPAVQPSASSFFRCREDVRTPPTHLGSSKNKVIIYRIDHQYVYIYIYNYNGETWSTNSEKRDVKLKIDEAENYVCETVKHLNALLM